MPSNFEEITKAFPYLTSLSIEQQIPIGSLSALNALHQLRHLSFDLNLLYPPKLTEVTLSNLTSLIIKNLSKLQQCEMSEKLISHLTTQCVNLKTLGVSHLSFPLVSFQNLEELHFGLYTKIDLDHFTAFHPRALRKLVLIGEQSCFFFSPLELK